MQEEHAAVPIYVGDGGAGFSIGRHIGQFVRFAKSFPIAGSTYAAGDVEFFVDDVMPDVVNGVEVLLIAGEGGYICHAGVHISSAYGVANSFVLVSDFFVRLVVFTGEGGAGAAYIQEKFGKVQVGSVACDTVHLRETGFDDLVAGPFFFFAVAEGGDKEVGVFDGDIQ